MQPNVSNELGSRSASYTHHQSGPRESQNLVMVVKTMPWERFYRIQTRRLYRLAVSMGVPRDQIEDVIQEVWLAAIEQVKRFLEEDGELRFSAWLVGVLRHKSRDVLRRLNRRREISLLDLPVATIDPKADEPAQSMTAMERDKNLTAQLEQLQKRNPLNCRLVREHILEGRSLEDLAAETGLAINAVSCRISRALRWLRARLRE